MAGTTAGLGKGVCGGRTISQNRPSDVGPTAPVHGGAGSGGVERVPLVSPTSERVPLAAPASVRQNARAWIVRRPALGWMNRPVLPDRSRPDCIRYR